MGLKRVGCVVSPFVLSLVVSSPVMSCHLFSYCVGSFDVLSSLVVSCLVESIHVPSCCVMSCHVLTWQSCHVWGQFPHMVSLCHISCITSLLPLLVSWRVLSSNLVRRPFFSCHVTFCYLLSCHVLVSFVLSLPLATRRSFLSLLQRQLAFRLGCPTVGLPQRYHRAPGQREAESKKISTYTAQHITNM